MNYKTIVGALRTPDPAPGREEMPPPRLHAVGVAEQRCIAPRFQPIVSATLRVAQSDRQILDRSHLLIHDGTVTDSRPKDAVAAASQDIDERLQVRALQQRQCA